MTESEAYQYEAWAFALVSRAAKADALDVVADVFEAAGFADRAPIRRQWARTLREAPIVGPNLEEVRRRFDRSSQPSGDKRGGT